MFRAAAERPLTWRHWPGWPLSGWLHGTSGDGSRVTRQPAASPGPLSGTVASTPRTASAQTESMLRALTLLFRGGGAVLIGVATFAYSAGVRPGPDHRGGCLRHRGAWRWPTGWWPTCARGHRQPRCPGRCPDRDGSGVRLRQHGRARGTADRLRVHGRHRRRCGQQPADRLRDHRDRAGRRGGRRLVTGASATSALGFPLLLIVAFVSGRNRAAYRRQAEQSAALVTRRSNCAPSSAGSPCSTSGRGSPARSTTCSRTPSARSASRSRPCAPADRPQRHRPGAEVLDQAQRMASDGLVETRRAVHALRADTAAAGRGVGRPGRHAPQRHRRTVSLDRRRAPRPLPPEATVALMRTAQEALANTAKHARTGPWTSICVRRGRSAR